MKDMKMKTKMIIGFVIPTIFIIINAWVGMSTIKDISKRVDEMQQQQITDITQTMKDIGADEEKASIVVNAIADEQAVGSGKYREACNQL